MGPSDLLLCLSNCSTNSILLLERAVTLEIVLGETMNLFRFVIRILCVANYEICMLSDIKIGHCF